MGPHEASLNGGRISGLAGARLQISGKMIGPPRPQIKLVNSTLLFTQYQIPGPQ